MLVTLTITSMRCTFAIKTGAGLLIPRNGARGGHSSLKHLPVTNSWREIGPQRTDERMVEKECVNRLV